MNRRLKSSLVTLAVLAVVVAAIPAAAAPPRGSSLRSTLEVAKYWHEMSDEVALTFTLTNQGADSVFVLRWLTPIDGVEADLLVVERDGQPVPYVGKLIKRPAPELEDYVEIPAGESLSLTFDPSAAYDMSIKGQYTIRFRALLQDTLIPAADIRGEGVGRSVWRPALPEGIESNSVTLWVEGGEPEDGAVPTLTIQGKGSNKGKPGGSGDPDYANCTTTQKDTLITAKSNATAISDKALTYLNGGNDKDLLYKTWFDYYAAISNGWNTAKNHFSAISDAFHNKPITFDCSCRQRYYAYVYSNQPYKIYLCKVFWSAPNLGTDSKAGTLVHETSHFNVVAGTDDFVYGTAGAQNLAKTDPNKALNNADNHEYFAEHQK